MDEDTKIAGLKLLALPTVIGMLLIAMIPLGIFNAWVTLKLYNWFLVPLHAPHLNVWHVWGIALIINRFTSSSPDEKDTKKLVGKIIVGVVLGLIALLIGYILKSHINY